MADTTMPGSLALAIPAYNEADGIAEFLVELDEALVNWAGPVQMFVVDDASNDETSRVLDDLTGLLKSQLVAETNKANLGHGPTVLRAYRLALESGADYILQVDGDGQFEGRQCWDLFSGLADADVAAGVRISRTDPWFRKVLSASVRIYLRLFFGVTRRDANCPFRMYRRGALARLLDEVEPDSAIPTIYLSVLESKQRLTVTEVVVRHRVRRGDSAQGTTWGTRRSLLVPTRLVRFVWNAFVESLNFRARLRKP